VLDHASRDERRLLRPRRANADVRLALRERQDAAVGDEHDLDLRVLRVEAREERRHHPQAERVGGGDANGAGEARLFAGELARDVVGLALHSLGVREEALARRRDRVTVGRAVEEVHAERLFEHREAATDGRLVHAQQSPRGRQ